MTWAVMGCHCACTQTATMALLSRNPIRATAPGTEMLSSSLLLTGRDSIAVATTAMAAM